MLACLVTYLGYAAVLLARAQDRGMYGDRGDHATGAHGVPGSPEDREVVRLRAARGEDDLVGAASKQQGHFGSRLLDCAACLAAVRVQARGVPEALAQEGEHGVQHLGQNRGGGVVVEVYGTGQAAHRTGSMVLRRVSSSCALRCSNSTSRKRSQA